jgi:hypothetical protein
MSVALARPYLCHFWINWSSSTAEASALLRESQLIEPMPNVDATPASDTLPRRHGRGGRKGRFQCRWEFAMSRAAAEAQRHSAVRFATEHLIGRHNMLIGLLARAKLGLLQQVT